MKNVVKFLLCILIFSFVITASKFVYAKFFISEHKDICVYVNKCE